MSPTKEEWRVIPEFPAYAVSDRGRVKRITAGPGTQTGRILKQFTDRTGYAALTLRREGMTCPRRVHKLVAEAFLGPCPEDGEVNHKDSNRMNPALSNLEYVNRVENMQHSLSTRRTPTGEHRHNAKLKECQAWFIRFVYRAGGTSQRSLAKTFGIARQTVGQLVRGERWRSGSHPGCGINAQLGLTSEQKRAKVKVKRKGGQAA